MADEADLAWLKLPPPPQELKVEIPAPQSQEPKADQNLRAYGRLKYAAHPWPQRSNWVDGDDPSDGNRLEEGAPELKVEPRSEAEEPPKVEVKPEMDNNPQVHVKPARTVRLYPLRSNRTDEPPNQLKYRPRDRHPRDTAHSEDSKRSRRLGGATGERHQAGESPSRSTTPALDGIRLFKGSLVKGGFGKPRPKP